jgi:hypothetical protein
MSSEQNIDIPIDYIMQDEYEIDETKQYKLEDLHLGMRVLTNQLYSIYSTHIILANPISVVLPDYTYVTAGIIVYIGEKLNEKAKEAYDKYTVYNRYKGCKVSPMVIYNEPDYESEDYICQPTGDST